VTIGSGRPASVRAREISIVHEVIQITGL